MAAQLTPEQFEIFRQHVEKFPKMSACPICESRLWGIAGIETAASYNMEWRYPDLAGVATPVITVVCRTCFYTRSFSWIGILRSLGKEPSSG